MYTSNLLTRTCNFPSDHQIYQAMVLVQPCRLLQVIYIVVIVDQIGIVEGQFTLIHASFSMLISSETVFSGFVEKCYFFFKHIPHCNTLQLPACQTKLLCDRNRLTRELSACNPWDNPTAIRLMSTYQSTRFLWIFPKSQGFWADLKTSVVRKFLGILRFQFRSFNKIHQEIHLQLVGSPHV